MGVFRFRRSGFGGAGARSVNLRLGSRGRVFNGLGLRALGHQCAATFLGVIFFKAESLAPSPLFVDPKP